jgi:apolipoprotein D and lipocalin family protein
MSRLKLLAVLTLAACVGKAPQTPQGQYRHTATPMYSSAVLDMSRLPGRWQQVAAFGPEGACAPGGVEIKPGLKTALRLCLSGAEVKASGALKPVGPGRFEIAGQEWWVIWADGDYRTLAIGTPSGAFGFILNRGGAISGDRLTAAKEIFEWNGYDLAQFHAFGG